MERKKVTIEDLKAKKQLGEKITRVSCYDYPMALLADRAGIDMILVGDSLGMTVLGYDNTLPVTMDEMIHHCKAVSKAAEHCLLVGDMPFMSYQASLQEAITNAGRFLKEGGMDAVKVEGGRQVAPIIKAIVDAGIPVYGDIGLNIQAIIKAGYKVVGKDAAKARELIEDAKILEEAGCFLLTLEGIPDRLAKIITETVSIPTVGLGAGPHCDGQTMILYDMIGLFEKFTPTFVKRYVDVGEQIYEAIRKFKEEVQSGAFPAREHYFTIKDEVLEKLLKK